MSSQSFDGNGLAASRSDAGTPPPGHLAIHRRTSQKSSGGSERSNSPISRTLTPSLTHNPNIAPQHIFDGASLTEHNFQPSPSLPTLHLSHPSPRSTSSFNGEGHLEPPQTYDGLVAANTTLKTRVNELEVVNQFYKERVTQLEQDEANARRAGMTIRDSEHRFRMALEESQQREDDLKRRIEELERDLADGQPHNKKMRLSEVVDSPDVASK